MTAHEADIAVIGAGAAGLMASIWAARTLGPGARVIALDTARTLGAKILVAGGGRCNVTHHAVDESAFAGSSRNAIRKVLRRFDVPQTTSFFSELGVQLKREETGKLFPVTDSARTVLNALLTAAASAGVVLTQPWRVDSVTPALPDTARGPAFTLRNDSGQRLRARRVILCTGGRSLPKSGSDGHGHAIARSLGHTITPALFPALVPLLLPQNHPLLELSGLTFPATLELRSPTGKLLTSFTDSTLFTHFGLSGPSVLDISRYLLAQRPDLSRGSTSEPPAPPAGPEQARLSINFLLSESPPSLDQNLQSLARLTVGRYLSERLPERLARALCALAGVDFSTPGHALTRDQRKSLAAACTALPLPITGNRGWNYAEVTAGGVPLSEIHLDSMESRPCPGLHLAGEICDVDGRIGGFNFQWAWASGFTAGTGAASLLLTNPGTSQTRQNTERGASPCV